MSNVVLSYDPEGGASESVINDNSSQYHLESPFFKQIRKKSQKSLNSLINELFYFNNFLKY
ncbi:hypothetical protein [Proteus terrae]|uniref:hypothetical protein n=1 Tax=Proteus terrae TaxID=1574161 RepID=UPI003075BC70